MRRLLLLCATAVVLFAGCVVSTDTFNKAVVESDARKVKVENLTRDLEGAKAENDGLRKEMAALGAAKEVEIASVKAKLDELSNRGIMTTQEIGDLRLERQRLASLNKTKDAELDSIKKSFDEAGARAASLTKDIDGLRQDKDRLTTSDKVKSDEIALLNATLINLTKENDYLKREVERLQVKTGELSAAKEKELSNVKSTYENLVKEMQSEINKGEVKITQAVDRLSVNMVEKILFDSGKAEVKPAGLKVLNRVGNVLKAVTDRQVRVEGHTDNIQIGGRLKEKYPTNWELSTARAANVVRYLQDNVGIDPKLLSVAGLAENKPVASNDTAEGRALNRRIEIVLLPLDVDRVLEELKK